jgi:hypothetical protein
MDCSSGACLGAKSPSIPFAFLNEQGTLTNVRKWTRRSYKCERIQKAAWNIFRESTGKSVWAENCSMGAAWLLFGASARVDQEDIAWPNFPLPPVYQKLLLRIVRTFLRWWMERWLSQRGTWRDLRSMEPRWPCQQKAIVLHRGIQYGPTPDCHWVPDKDFI